MVMSEEIITKITDIVIQQTIGQKIPTVIFLSDIDKGSLVKNIIWSIKGGTQDEDKFLSDDWQRVAEIMQTLAEVPLLLKETSDINEIKVETENFIKEINKGKGVVIINAKGAQTNQFLSKDNISVIIV